MTKKKRKRKEKVPFDDPAVLSSSGGASTMGTPN